MSSDHPCVTDAVTQAVEVWQTAPERSGRSRTSSFASSIAQPPPGRGSNHLCDTACVCSMQELVSQAPKLRRVKHRLWADTLAVCSEVRPAFLMDFCPTVPPRAVQAMCMRLTAVLRKRIFVLTWQGCLWVVSQTRLAVRLESILSPRRAHPPEMWLIDFCIRDAFGPPCVRPAQSQVCLVSQSTGCSVILFVYLLLSSRGTTTACAAVS